MATAGDKDTAAQVLQLRLMVDKQKMRVVYAECGREMADVLFSFLTTPVGALVRQTGGDSGLGCMDSLYKSVEGIDSDLFETPACREILLRPRSASEFAYHRLKIAINDADRAFPCVCPSGNCPKFSLFMGARCECGRDMTGPLVTGFPPPAATSALVFLREKADSFIVTDDLFIAPSSHVLKHRICAIAEVELQTHCLEEQIVFVDSNKMVNLMKASLLSNTPLTDTFIQSGFVTKPIIWPSEFLHQHLKIFPSTKNPCFRTMNKLLMLGKDFVGSVTDLIFQRKKMAITLFHNQKSVLYARVGSDFVDLLFSFLTCPFGSIITFIGGQSSLGCLGNLHKVVKRFISDGHFYSRDSASRLLNPPVAYHHGCESHLIKMGSQILPVYQTNCKTCCDRGVDTLCADTQHTHFEWKAINPKSKERVTSKRGGYIRSPNTFVITSGLHVKPFDSRSHYATGRLEEKNVIVGRKEALKLLMACLISNNPLTDVFLYKMD